MVFLFWSLASRSISAPLRPCGNSRAAGFFKDTIMLPSIRCCGRFSIRSFSHSSLRLSTKITRWRIGKDPFPSACDSCASCFAVSRWPHPAGFFKGTIMLPSIRCCGQILHLFSPSASLRHSGRTRTAGFFPGCYPVHTSSF